MSASTSTIHSAIGSSSSNPYRYRPEHGDQRALFALGAQRSGTTPLGRLLATHEDICMTVNGKLLYYLSTWIYRDPRPEPGRHHGLTRLRTRGNEWQHWP